MIEIQTRGEVAVLRMRHGKVNALDAEMLRAITAAVREIEASDAKALVLTGHGSVFSAGADLMRVLNEGREYVEQSLPVLAEAFTTLFAYPRPSVAAVNGHAIAGGAVLAFCCDYRVMEDGRGTFGVSELRVGVAYPVAALEIVRFAVGAKGLQELVYFGENYDPSESLQRRLVDELCEPNTSLDVALARAERLARIPAESFTAAKRQLRDPTVRFIETEAPRRDPAAVDAWASEDVRASVVAFLDSLKKG